MKTKNRKQHILLAGLAAALLVLATACSGNTTPTAATDAATQPAATDNATAAATDTAATAATDPSTLPFVTIDWYTSQMPCPDDKMVNDKLNEYLKEKLNMNVNLIYWEYTDWQQKLLVQVASGQDMGIVSFNIMPYMTAATQGAFAPLDSLLDQ